ncbi:hypothetical protein [Frankia gtarii]|uniref:hypothetical protein n=1 Tax=Frankia gtarii TaxID=2950102 RepID=UPI0021BEF9EA|nr:hypothetical protein [Frankia gtarii]
MGLTTAEHDLGMRGLLAPSRTGFHTGLFWRAHSLRLTRWETRYGAETLHGFGVAVLTLPGTPASLAVASVHLTPYSAAVAQEAQLVASRLLRANPSGLTGVPTGSPALLAAA